MSRTSYLKRPLVVLPMGAALAASLVLAAVVLASPAWAATYTVTTNADSGESSLRQAIIDANTNTGVADTINFELGSSATITLTSAQLPTITDAAGLTIDGGSADITISGANQYQVFQVGSDEEGSGAKLTLSNLTVANGAVFDFFGGGIANSNGTLEVINSTLSGNSSTGQSGGRGGAIYNSQGTVRVINSTISDNSVPFDGAGIYNSGGTLEVTNSTLSGNNADGNGGNGSGIYNQEGTATVSNSTLSGNSSTGSAGGILNSRARLGLSIPPSPAIAPPPAAAPTAAA